MSNVYMKTYESLNISDNRKSFVTSLSLQNNYYCSLRFKEKTFNYVELKIIDKIFEKRLILLEFIDFGFLC